MNRPRGSCERLPSSKTVVYLIIPIRRDVRAAAVSAPRHFFRFAFSLELFFHGVYDCFYENGTVYIAMEYLRGHTLKEHIRDNGVLGAPQALHIAKSICGALVVSHSASVLHRDITPDNVIVCDNGDIKLIDFGAARQVVAEHSQSFSVILKPGFAPPEQYKKKGNQGPWTDVYAVGTTLYFALTGDIPEDPSARFDCDDTFKENLFGVDPALWEIITKATKLKVNERYADAYELKKAFDTLPIKAEPIVAPDGSPEADTDTPVSIGSTADMAVSIRTIPPKRSFLRRYSRAVIEIACAALFTAVIVLLAVKVNKLSAADNVSASYGSSVSDDNSASDGSIASAVVGELLDLDKEGFTKPLYSCLSGEDKILYAYIYDGLRSSKESISIPSLVYSVSEVSDIFDDVLSDNPALDNISGYTLDYFDNNSNKEPDPDENVISITPTYTGADPNEADEFITKTLSELNSDSKAPIEVLRLVHDKLINETDLIGRNSTPNASTAHGALIEHEADDMGLARALCGYAQRLGFTSFAVDINLINNVSLAGVRVLVEGEWYNISILGDADMVVGNVFKMPIAEDGKISHMWFFISDFYMNATGLFKYVRDFGKKYAPVFPEPKGMSISGGETVMPIVNYYIEVYLNERWYYEVQTDNLYISILENAKTALEDGLDTFYMYILASDADIIWELMQDTFISDLKRKYSLTISGFETEYSGDCMTVTMQK